MHLQASQLWQAALRDLEHRLSKNAFENWLRPTSLLEIRDDTATISAPNTFGAATLESRYASEIAQVLAEIIGRPITVRVVVGTGSPATSDGQPTPADTAALVRAVAQSNGHRGRQLPGRTRGDDSPRQLELQASRGHGLNPRYVYETYVVGKSNTFAHAASLAVAEHPGQQYNPLYIYGGVGLGKTHLLHAIGHRALELRPEMQVVYVSSEKFTNDLIDAIRGQRMEDFRARYRTIDLLMIDDIQFIGGKDSTQEEFFHTFNTLYQGGRQVVISSDRPPSEIRGLEDRLRSRFEGGLTADVQPPDYEMRMAILRTKAEELSARLPDEVIEFIAQRDTTNTRELEGALNRVIALSRVGNRPITLPLAIEALSGGRSSRQRADITADEICTVVAQHFGIDRQALLGRGRAKEIVVPRHVAMYLLREETSASLVDIGKTLGGRDHTTVMHGIERIERQLRDDPALRSRILAIRDELYTPSP